MPRVLALHKIDVGRSPIPSEAVAALLKSCGCARSLKTSTVGVSVGHMVHGLLDDVLDLEVQRMGADACLVDWLVGHREPAQLQRQHSGDSPQGGAAELCPRDCVAGEQQEAVGDAQAQNLPTHARALSFSIPEMYFANEKKPTSMSSAEESDMEAWVGAASPEANSDFAALAGAREQRRDLKRIMVGTCRTAVVREHGPDARRNPLRSTTSTSRCSWRKSGRTRAKNGLASSRCMQGGCALPPAAVSRAVPDGGCRGHRSTSACCSC